ncbi:oligopeptidase family protein [Phlyctema vagabunda]|uniref:Dipeptidyl-peptidase V n=1 Tax=Phlyctema vagabunda TaxID=108571 RepID=A0ABR4PIP5_9HELO
MTIRTHAKFSPELLITAPRRSPAVPSPDGRYALYTVSTYSLDTHTETKEVKVLEFEKKDTRLFSDDSDILSPQWLVKNQILWLKKKSGGETELWIGTAGRDNKNAYRAGVIDASISNVTTKELPDGNIALGFSAPVGEDGGVFNAAKATKPLSSVREYDTVYVRFWDSYFPKERSTFWYTVLQRSDNHSTYKLSDTQPINALEGTGIDFPSGPSDSDSLGGDVEISTKGIIIASRDPEVDIAKKLTVGLWYISVPSYTKVPESVSQIRIPGFDGICVSPVCSFDGNAVAFLSTKSEAIGPDYNHIFVLYLFHNTKVLIEVFPVREGKQNKGWDLSPSSLLWSNDGTQLYITAADHGKGKLWKVPVQRPAEDSMITSLATIASPFPGDSTVSGVYPLSRNPSDGRILINTTSFVDNGTFFVTDPTRTTSVTRNYMTSNDISLGLRRSQVSEITFQGGGDYEVQAWILKPSNFDKNKTYPLAFLIHGGPAGTWADAWSTRWNPAVWAEQGYVVVAPNPTGSTSFGQAFAAAVKGDWGGRPYEDLVKCFEYVEENLPYVDTKRAIAAGGSYGGYMINWIAGQPLGRKFQTLICHDGIFSMYNLLGSDVPTALVEDMGCDLWEDKKTWDRYNPAAYTHNWKTPMLIIHSDNDFRCPFTEGLAVFNVCQLRGIPSRFLNFPDENHFVLNRENSLQWYRTVLGWANKYAGVKGGVELEPPLTEPSRRTAEKSTVALR